MADFRCECGIALERVAAWPVYCRCGMVAYEDGRRQRPYPSIGQPGTVLAGILRRLGYTFTEDDRCGCKDKTKLMNRGGLIWCSQNKRRIVGWLIRNAPASTLRWRVGAWLVVTLALRVTWCRHVLSGRLTPRRPDQV